MPLSSVELPLLLEMQKKKNGTHSTNLLPLDMFARSSRTGNCPGRLPSGWPRGAAHCSLPRAEEEVCAGDSRGPARCSLGRHTYTHTHILRVWSGPSLQTVPTWSGSGRICRTGEALKKRPSLSKKRVPSYLCISRRKRTFCRACGVREKLQQATRSEPAPPFRGQADPQRSLLDDFWRIGTRYQISHILGPQKMALFTAPTTNGTETPAGCGAWHPHALCCAPWGEVGSCALC